MSAQPGGKGQPAAPAITRPRGRAPKGKRWGASAGNWVPAETVQEQLEEAQEERQDPQAHDHAQHLVLDGLRARALERLVAKRHLRDGGAAQGEIRLRAARDP